MKRYFVTFGLIISVITGLQVFGIDLVQFRPVMVYEAQASNKIVIGYICRRLLNEWYIAKDLQSNYQSNNRTTPPWLLQKIVYLESKIGELHCRN